MRYIREEIIKTTVCDKDIIELSTIEELIDSIFKQGLKFSIIITKKLDKYEDKKLSYNVAQFISVSDSICDIRIFQNTAQGIIRGIKIEEIEEIKILNAKNDLVVFKENIGRFDLIDVGE